MTELCAVGPCGLYARPGKPFCSRHWQALPEELRATIDGPQAQANNRKLPDHEILAACHKLGEAIARGERLINGREHREFPA